MYNKFNIDHTWCNWPCAGLMDPALENVPLKICGEWPGALLLRSDCFSMANSSTSIIADLSAMTAGGRNTIVSKMQDDTIRFLFLYLTAQKKSCRKTIIISIFGNQWCGMSINMNNIWLASAEKNLSYSVSWGLWDNIFCLQVLYSSFLCVECFNAAISIVTIHNFTLFCFDPTDPAVKLFVYFGLLELSSAGGEFVEHLSNRTSGLLTFSLSGKWCNQFSEILWEIGGDWKLI